jgi:hypothetical protein
VATPIILPTQEIAIRRIAVQSQPRQILCETLSGKNPSQNWKKKTKRAGRMTQGVDPEFKPMYHTPKKKYEGAKVLTVSYSKHIL